MHNAKSLKRTLKPDRHVQDLHKLQGGRVVDGLIVTERLSVASFSIRRALSLRFGGCNGQECLSPSGVCFERCTRRVRT